jgi:uncharacterized delta-60 repeat protein
MLGESENHFSLTRAALSERGREKRFPISNNPMKTTLRKRTVVWPLVIFLLLPALTRAEVAVQAWVQRYNGPGRALDEACAVAVDGSNNVIVTGYSAGIAGDYDYATIKYSSAGVPLWTNRYNGLGNGCDEAYALAVDSSNNVIVTGASAGSGSGSDFLTIEYSSAGVPLWTNRYHGPGNSSDTATAVAVDSSNNVIVTGWSGNSVNYATIKYSSAGVPLWTNRYIGPFSYGGDFPKTIAVDRSGNVIVTGNSLSSSGGDYDYATIKYSSAGVPLWTNRYDGPKDDNDFATGVAVDSSNNVIVTGYSDGDPSWPLYDYATIKYSSEGVPLWTNRYNGPANGDDEAKAVAVDGSNNVIVTGSAATIKCSSAGVPLWTNPCNNFIARAVAVDGSNNVIATGWCIGSGSTYDYATIKYSSAGVPLWTNRYNGLGNGYDEACALAVDLDGNVIVTGCSPGTGSGGDDDFATIKYICVPSPVVTGLQLTNGTFQMRVDDVLQPGTLVIEAATNLFETNWVPVFTNTTPTNVLFYTDPDASNYLWRFYRAFQSP